MEVNTVAILGLLLLLSAAGLAVEMVLQNTASISVDALGLDYSLSAGWLFVAGVATGAIGLLGATMVVAGMTRARRRRTAFAESRTDLQGVQAERDRLADELERERAGRTIDLDEHRSEPAANDYATVSGGADRKSAVARERETAGADRHGLFHRRH